jgi:CRISPR-associated endonuclease Csn1
MNSSASNGLVFGIDLGIASCGWAVLRRPTEADPTGAIEAMGSWMFDVPETDKERTPTNQIRRGNRLLRRVVRRRAQRMAAVRRLFSKHGLLSTDDRDALKRADADPWELRARCLDKPLKSAELAVALGHIAKRRGFKSAAKRKEANTAGDDQKMLKALEATKERLGRYRTIGELFARDPDFQTRKRNRDGIFDRTQSRDDLLHEVRKIFEAQRRLGNELASDALEAAFVNTAFFQRPLQDSERLVGLCLFETTEKRAAKHAPSFEKFRLLTRLVNLRITVDDGERALTPEELAAATGDLGSTAKLSVKTIRKRIGLPDDQRFTAIKPDDEGHDIAARTGEAMHGTKKLRDALGEDIWASLLEQPEMLDRSAHVLSFFETAETIGDELKKLGLPARAVDRLLEVLPSFARFKGTGHLSAKAARALIPHLEAGLRYDQACDAVGYDHAASRWSKREQVVDKKSFNQLVKDTGAEIANPIARKSLTEGLKQLWAMRNRWGLPDAVHIEMARDVGNSLEERNKIKKRLDDTTAQRGRERDEAAEQLGVEPGDVGGDTLLRYRLWKEQGGECPYTGDHIPPSAIAATDNSFQVDHILPWSRFGDDSFNNKVLCIARANQEKRRDTPFEWIMRTKGEEGWELFATRIETNPHYRGFKKRNYTLKNATEAEERFRSRNLNDTRYACRLLAEAVKLFYPEGERQDRDGKRRVFTRPGSLTAALRHAWGIESLKKVDGERVNDARHHALDALVVAAVGEWEVHRLTKSFQEWEQRGLARPLRRVEPPWGDFNSFRREVQDAYDAIFVARPERRRARGEGHAATIRQVKERDGAPVVFERKAVADLKEKDLERIKDPERNKAVIEAIRQWIADGRPVDALPRSPAGDEIRRVRLSTKGKPSVRVRGGTADRGDIVRVDVFSKPNKRGKEEFYLVPIYPHQVMDKKQWSYPPSKAVVAYKDEEDWVQIEEAFQFRTSICPRSFLEVTKPDGEILLGYFQGMNRATGAISLFNDKDTRNRRDDAGNSLDGIGAKRLLTIKKYSVDRFGNRSEVKSEVRTWHGAVCTSPTPPD